MASRELKFAQSSIKLVNSAVSTEDLILQCNNDKLFFNKLEVSGSGGGGGSQIYPNVKALGDNPTANCITFDQENYMIKSYSFNTAGSNINSMSHSNFPEGAQAIFYVTHTGGNSDIVGSTGGDQSFWDGAYGKVNFDKVAMSGGKQAVITMVKGPTNTFISASAYETVTP